MIDRLLLLCEKYPLDFSAYFSSSLPIIIALLRYKRFSLNLFLITIFFIAFFIKETFSFYYAIHNKNNLYLENLEIFVNIIIITAITYANFRNRQWRNVFGFLASICLVVSLLFYKNDTVSSVSVSTFRLFSIFVCLSYFNKILTDMQIKNIMYHTLFWFLSGLLIFSAGTFFIMLLSEYWYKDITVVPPEVFDKYWNASQILFIVFSLLSAYGLWVSKYDQENLA